MKILCIFSIKCDTFRSKGYHDKFDLYCEFIHLIYIKCSYGNPIHNVNDFANVNILLVYVLKVPVGSCKNYVSVF